MGEVSDMDAMTETALGWTAVVEALHEYLTILRQAVVTPAPGSARRQESLSLPRRYDVANGACATGGPSASFSVRATRRTTGPPMVLAWVWHASSSTGAATLTTSTW